MRTALLEKEEITNKQESTHESLEKRKYGQGKSPRRK